MIDINLIRNNRKLVEENLKKKYQESKLPILDEIISLAIRTYKRKKRKVYSFESNILSNFNGLKGSKGKLKM